MTTDYPTVPMFDGRERELEDRYAGDVRMPERVPWSHMAQDFAVRWGRSNPKDPQPEHVEVLGPSGSGKTYLIGTLLGDRVRVRDTAIVALATKEADATLMRLQLPIVETWRDIQRNRQCIFWPRTELKGTERRAYHERKLYEVLARLWVREANVIVEFDEIGYVESLSRRIKDLVEQYWREARSQKITVMAGKQRPQGAGRSMHSETPLTFMFPPTDEDDLERFAQLMGPRRLWMPIIRGLDNAKREFLVKNFRTGDTFISWIDYPLRPIPRRGRSSGIYGQRRHEQE
jgi:nucleoside-triphosphatase THEP1